MRYYHPGAEAKEHIGMTKHTLTSGATLRAVVSGATASLESAIAGTPTDLINRRQPGSANPIGATYAHALISLDTCFSEGIQGGRLLFVTGGFAQQLGFEEPGALGWPALQAIAWDLAALQPYAQALYHAVDSYLARLDDAELGRTCTVFGQATTVSDTIALGCWHTALHAGEIAALKGVSGTPGLPF